MRQTLILKLETTPAHYQALLETVEAFNRACQYVADVAYEQHSANKIALQPLVYSELRKRFKLSSQMAVRSISKACEAYKPLKRLRVHIDLHDPMIFDQRIMSFKGLTEVSLLCLTGRQHIPFRFGAYQSARPDRVPGQADLVLRDGVFYLNVCIDLPTPPPADGAADMVGVRLREVGLARNAEAEAHASFNARN